MCVGENELDTDVYIKCKYFENNAILFLGEIL